MKRVSKDKDSALEKILQYRRKHGWDKSDTPNILAKSIYIEATELLENFMKVDRPHHTNNIREELADILMYAISLSHDMSLDYKQIMGKALLARQRKK